ncbi:peptidoglycan-binding protein [Lysinibacillus sp. FJAT-14745]|uniref:LysM peptidoglycan-binding and 3D domain-containing protein n=1 Tax=Lysinibacillus sp. FJAT-14745 TaxID=1704289 RepID=UPI0006AB808E|nr:LysM peptidoglycan-binding and 3D domain-containing protein [Lysinibacillus sp. FJAT-14745]KOP71422.1 peptidoglycan-binding protein [Lysinibacillus sp. FJAT-14745]
MKKQALALAVTLTLGLSLFASPSSAEEKHTFKPYDVLWGISKIYNLSLGDYEPIADSDAKWFYPEQDLNVGESKKDNSMKDQHFVVAGDTLFSIASVNSVSVEELKEWNNLPSDLIYVGESLAIKASAAKPKTSESKTKKVATTSSKKKVTTSSANAVSAPANTGKTLTMRATAYTAYCEGCSGITANGTDIRSNPNLKVIAVDPRVIPLGSRVWVEGYGEAIAADTGGAIKGNKIDVFIPTEGQARQWGVKHVTVKILN